MLAAHNVPVLDVSKGLTSRTKGKLEQDEPRQLVHATERGGSLASREILSWRIPDDQHDPTCNNDQFNTIELLHIMLILLCWNCFARQVASKEACVDDEGDGMGMLSIYLSVTALNRFDSADRPAESP